ncbi:amidohydrolase family protein [Actinomadura syzygii]|uniref:Amidohydrolase family protein n=1 Tax=Actinomadura syzygii TaxID=1427538 RepID=A0A5D0U8Y8_9ACTN|nr:amidohydrolase family protein [Actinomadura syzygii]TYC15031.1 amidohydrolase family protein [Actinomadura syzygii]
MNTPFDVVVRNGRWFDGTGASSAVRDVGIRDGRVAAVSARPLPAGPPPSTRVIDATGRWVLPGFVDMHTHYDAEVLLDPGLGESVRHGVTTVVMGNCSLSTVHAGPVDCADLFARVEAVPRGLILDALTENKSWTSAAEYVAALETRPLGPNVAAFLGHSDLRAHVMGLGRAVDPRVRPDEAELRRMEALLAAARAAGLVGLSTMTSPFSRLAGDRHRSAKLPSTYATWREYRRLHRVLRRTGGILQSAPNPAMPLNTLLFVAASAAPAPTRRAPLRTTLLTAIDPKSAPGLAAVLVATSHLAGRALGADLRWQHLPVPFELYSDGIDLVVFEEFGATAEVLHLRTEAERRRLLQDTGFRRRFRREYRRPLPRRAWHRDLYDAEIVACPEPGLAGRSFGDVADARGRHPVDAFLDLVAEHGPKLRWRTTLANHRPAVLDRLAAEPAVQFGFADSGAHLRNMAFYNAPLRLLKRVRDADRAGRPILTLEHAVHRLTGELAGWLGLDAGTLRVGDRADLVVVDPDGLDGSLAAYHEAPMAGFGGLSRMVNRNDAAVPAVCVGGEVVFADGAFAPGYGRVRATGRFLRHERGTR